MGVIAPMRPATPIDGVAGRFMKPSFLVALAAFVDEEQALVDHALGAIHLHQVAFALNEDGLGALGDHDRLDGGVEMIAENDVFGSEQVEHRHEGAEAECARKTKAFIARLVNDLIGPAERGLTP